MFKMLMIPLNFIRLLLKFENTFVAMHGCWLYNTLVFWSYTEPYNSVSRASAYPPKIRSFAALYV